MGDKPLASSMSTTTDSPEYAFVRLLARARLTASQADELRQRAEDVDWRGVLGLAAHHRLLPLLWVHLSEHAQDAAPEEVVGALHRHARSTAVDVLFLSSEMARIARRFQEERVPFLVLKGPSLAEAYGGIAQRPFVDNDLLVRRSDFGRVEQTLLDLGFRRRKRSQRQLDGYLYVHGEYTFGRTVGDRVSTVDVHTSVTPRGYAYRGGVDDLEGRARTIHVSNEAVRALSWEDLFLALCVNALKDQWNRLRLASDLAEVGAFVDDWEGLERRAAEVGSLRAYRIGVLVATDEVGASFPEAVVTRARADRTAVGLAADVRAHLRTFHEERVMGSRDRARLVLQAQDGARGRARYLAYVAVRRLTERLVDPRRPEDRAVVGRG